MRGKGSGRRSDPAKRAEARALRARGLAQVAEALGITRQGAHYLLVGRKPRRSRVPLHCPRCGAALGAVGLPGEEGLCLPCLQRPGLVGVGDRLRAHRLAAGLSRAQLGRKADLAEATVGQLEHGENVPRPETLRKLAEALGVGWRNWTRCGARGRSGA